MQNLINYSTNSAASLNVCAAMNIDSYIYYYEFIVHKTSLIWCAGNEKYNRNMIKIKKAKAIIWPITDESPITA